MVSITFSERMSKLRTHSGCLYADNMHMMGFLLCTCVFAPCREDTHSLFAASSEPRRRTDMSRDLFDIDRKQAAPCRT